MLCNNNDDDDDDYNNNTVNGPSLKSKFISNSKNWAKYFIQI